MVSRIVSPRAYSVPHLLGVRAVARPRAYSVPHLLGIRAVARPRAYSVPHLLGVRAVARPRAYSVPHLLGVRAVARHFLFVLSVAFALALPDNAIAALRVVATFPDLADMARQIGGDRVAVEPLADGRSDPHRVPMKPSFVTKLNRADALIVMGLGMEHAFLPGLLEVARNAAIQPGRAAYIDASLHITPLDVPESLDRSQGELHPLGNPHFNLDPVRGRDMARAIAEGLARVDPEGAAAYRDGLARFTATLDRRIAEWERLAAPLHGAKIVSYHSDLTYLAERYGLEVVGTIETRPGVPATAGHIEELVARMKDEHVRLIVREVSYEQRLADSIAERTGATVVTLSILAGGLPDTSSYLDFIDANVRALLAGVEGGSTKMP